jgi:hypothetical protein
MLPTARRLNRLVIAALAAATIGLPAAALLPAATPGDTAPSLAAAATRAHAAAPARAPRRVSPTIVSAPPATRTGVALSR